MPHHSIFEDCVINMNRLPNENFDNQKANSFDSKRCPWFCYLFTQSGMSSYKCIKPPYIEILEQHLYGNFKPSVIP